MYDILSDPRILRITISLFELLGIDNTFTIYSRDEEWLDDLELPYTTTMNVMSFKYKGSFPGEISGEFYKTFCFIKDAPDDFRLIIKMMKAQ